MTETFAERLARQAPDAFPGGLRLAQDNVLSQYAALPDTDTADVGIELPTGEGKTLIGLLLADWALDEGMTVAYLTGTKQLTQQVLEQAGRFDDLPVHAFAGGQYPGAALLDYHQAQAVGVMNYWVYFNSSPKVKPAKLVIFDDAHLAEQPLSGMYTVRIDRKATGGRGLYEKLCDLVLQHAPSGYPTLRALRDGAAPAGSPPELIAFNDWAQVADTASEMIAGSAYLCDNRGPAIAWRTVAPNATRCGVLVGPTGIEIRPYHPPTQTHPGYSSSARRVYLSATLGRAGDLQRRLGVKPVTAIDTPAYMRTTATGRRTFAINPGSEPALSGAPLRFALAQSDAAAQDGPGRVAWLCASGKEADEVQALLEDRGLPVFPFRAGDDTPFDTWRVTDRAHLVTAGRFDGLDLAGDTCRLVVIPSVPAASSEFERFAVAYLGDASFMRHRIGQRVTQALGRANRSGDDSGLYLGLDPAFAATLADSDVYASLGTEVQEVVRAALGGHGDGWKPPKEAARQFWSTHRDPPDPATAPTPARRRRPGPGQPTAGPAAASPRDSAPHEVEATTLFWLGDRTAAASAASAAADALADAGEPEHSAFWRYVQAHALYDRPASPDAAGARQAIEKAINAAPRTAWFIRLGRTAEELAGQAPTATAHDGLFLAWDEWLREAGADIPAELATARGALARTDGRPRVLTVLARLCGAAAPAGEPTTWAWASRQKGQRRVWDTAPTPATGPDVNTLLGHVRQQQDDNPRTNVVGCLLTDTVPDNPAQRSARDSMCLLHPDFVLALFDRTADLFGQYRTAWGAGSAAERGSARTRLETRLPAEGDWLATLLAPTAGRLPQAVDAVQPFA